MHVIDHLDRLADRCSESERWAILKEDPQLAMIKRELATAVNDVREALVHGERTVYEEGLEAAWQVLQHQGRNAKQNHVTIEKAEVQP